MDHTNIFDKEKIKSYIQDCSCSLISDCSMNLTMDYSIFTDDQLFDIVNRVLDINYIKTKNNLKNILTTRELIINNLEISNNQEVSQAIRQLFFSDPNNELLKKMINLFFIK
jgi:hypothetical protein